MAIDPPKCPPVVEIPKPPPPPPPPKPKPNIPPKLLAIMKKYKYNWRLTQLSKQIPFKISKKFVRREEPIGFFEPNVKPGVTTGFIPDRIKDAATSPLWKLKKQKKYYTESLARRVPKEGRKKFYAAMKKNINATWGSIYYYYRRSIYLKQQKAAKAQKDQKPDKDAKKLKEQLLQLAIERCGELATPKKVFKPDPIKRTVVKDWHALLTRLELLSEPTHRERKYKRPSIDSQYVDPSAVKPEALKYKISPIINDLATRLPERYTRVVIPIIPGTVSRAALKAKITPRIEELALPKKRADAPEMDVKENPFAVSKNALKYKATPRIEELAKPIER